MSLFTFCLFLLSVLPGRGHARRAGRHMSRAYGRVCGGRFRIPCRPSANLLSKSCSQGYALRRVARQASASGLCPVCGVCTRTPKPSKARHIRKSPPSVALLGMICGIADRRSPPTSFHIQCSRGCCPLQHTALSSCSGRPPSGSLLYKYEATLPAPPAQIVAR